MNQKIHQILYTLRRIHTYGRDSLENLLVAIRMLEAYDGDKLSARGVQGALEKVVVTGADDADKLLGCMQMLDELVGEEASHNHDGDDQ